MAALGWLLNLGFAGGGTVVVVEDAVDRGRDAGSGKKRDKPPWWAGEWIDPHEVYAARAEVPPAPARVAMARQAAENLVRQPGPSRAAGQALRTEVTKLARRLARFEARAERVATEKAALATVRRYRILEREARALAARAERLERDEKRRRLIEEDEIVIRILADLL